MEPILPPTFKARPNEQWKAATELVKAAVTQTEAGSINLEAVANELERVAPLFVDPDMKDQAERYQYLLKRYKPDRGGIALWIEDLKDQIRGLETRVKEKTADLEALAKKETETREALEASRKRYKEINDALPEYVWPAPSVAHAIKGIVERDAFNTRILVGIAEILKPGPFAGTRLHAIESVMGKFVHGAPRARDSGPDQLNTPHPLALVVDRQIMGDARARLAREVIAYVANALFQAVMRGDCARDQEGEVAGILAILDRSAFLFSKPIVVELPEAGHTSNGADPKYLEGWNDCTRIAAKLLQKQGLIVFSKE